jgi:hypothetical protein
MNMRYDATQPVNLPVEDFLQLELHLMDTRPDTTPHKFVADLVKRWLAVENERLALRRDGPALRGFQWKSLFLPDGTKLRTTFGETVEFATVRGDRIVSDDCTAFTPSQFANRRATGRNAWRFIWLRFPGCEHWTLADNCRERAKNRRGNRPKEARMV